MTENKIDREKILRRYLERKYREGALDEFFPKSQKEQRQIAVDRAAKYKRYLSNTISQTVLRKEKVLSTKVVNYLTKSYKNIFNEDNTPVSVRILSQDLNEDKNDIRRVCKNLADQGIIQEISIGKENKFYRIYAK